MVHVRMPYFRTGYNPSKQTSFNPTQLTPTQRLLLVRNRIWGNIVGGSVRSGFKELAKPIKGPAYGEFYAQSDLKMIYPFIKDWEKSNKYKTTYEERKLRIFMRGIKIGVKQGSTMKGMEMFEQKQQVKDEAAAKAKL